jgi:hypothetical protein
VGVFLAEKHETADADLFSIYLGMNHVNSVFWERQFFGNVKGDRRI